MQILTGKPGAGATFRVPVHSIALTTELPMQGPFLSVLAIAFAAALSSLAGGAAAIFFRPSSLFLSICVGFAGGVLLGTFAFEMMPKALELSALVEAVAGFATGIALVYGLDLFVNRGAIAGPKAEQRPQVSRYHRRYRPRGDEVTVLAAGTSVEEVIEGLTIGVGAAIDPGVALIVGLAIAIDNVSEGLTIGELIRQEDGAARHSARILKWTGLIGISVFASAIAGWLLLNGMPQPLLGFLFAAGAGGMFYLTVTNLIPEAESRQYLQSAALSIAAGFLVILVLSELR